MTPTGTSTSSAEKARLAALCQAAQALGASLDLDETLARVLDAAMRLTVAERGCLMLPDDAGELAIRAARSAAGQDLAPEAVELAGVAEPARPGPPVLTTTARGSSLAVPLSLGGQPSGALYVDRPLGAGAFDAGDLDLLSAFAGQAALAVENARLNAAVRRANEARAEFVRTVTHELKIPMTSIKGYTELLKMVGPLNAQQEQFVGTIRVNVDRMAVLVSDLADIARIESGRLKYELRSTSLIEAVLEAAEGLRSQFEARQQPVHIELAPGLPPVQADPQRLGQILTTLLNNANKYSPVGRPVVVRAEPEADNVRVSVIDQGYGMSPADQARLFSQFFRSDDANIREQNGWGLGLHIARRLVELMGGTLLARSELGTGSMFSFTLPVAPAE